ncbi:hypothetical protein Ahy_Scaffold6g107836 [Arachis hypogaea]|uniref:Uncharacterized protein n=1 Tax=Arachis hypogaea TaxID=3818 RepID=A0A444WNP0_ARAHY|nr:hypothetical protein Ahy_Scaffold6g107836 [Arachis hypogaea]
MKAVVAKKSFDAFELRLHGDCQEIIRCFGTEITVEHIRHFYNLFLEYAPYSSLADLIHKKPLSETQT